MSGRVWLLALLSLALSSGAAVEPTPSTAPPLESLSVSADVLPWIEMRLERVNPTLAPRMRRRIAAAVARYSQIYQLDPALVTAVIEVESDARPWARSPKGALGLMQVMPHMMEPLELAGNAATVESNIEAGCRILAGNIARLGEARGISAYFWGSRIRNLVYLEKVQQALAEIRRLQVS